jgi:hypothetical protein
LSTKDLEAVDRLSKGIVAKLLHGPMNHLRQQKEGDATRAAIEQIQEAFQLEPRLPRSWAEELVKRVFKLANVTSSSGYSAVFEAAVEVQKSGNKVKPEIMIPLVGFKKELDIQVEVVHRIAKEVMAEKKTKIDLKIVGSPVEFDYIVDPTNISNYTYRIWGYNEIIYYIYETIIEIFIFVKIFL